MVDNVPQIIVLDQDLCLTDAPSHPNLNKVLVCSSLTHASCIMQEIDHTFREVNRHSTIVQNGKRLLRKILLEQNLYSFSLH